MTGRMMQVLTVLGLGALVLLVGPLWAQPTHVCLQLLPFVDVLQCSALESTVGEVTIYEAHCRWRAGAFEYQLLGSGSATQSLGEGGTVDVGLTFVNPTDFFGGNHDVSFAGVLPDGRWTLKARGGEAPFDQEDDPEDVQRHVLSIIPCPSPDDLALRAQAMRAYGVKRAGDPK